MDSFSTLEMRVLEENSEYLGVSKRLLMENAGRQIAEFCKKILGSRKARIVVVAGPGNNGGDGFVAARYLSKFYEVDVFLASDPSKIRTLEARENWSILEKMKLTIRLHHGYDVENLEKLLEKSDLIIDALFGTGLRGDIREPYASIINCINACSKEKIIIAVDIPSGLNPDTGDVHGVAVKADYTITFHALKRGLLDRREYTGEILVVDIGIPREVEFMAGPGDVIAVVKPRKAYSKKGDFGRILVIGGSRDYSGAPALSALAALRTGADLVTIAAPSSVADVIKAFSPALIVKKLSKENLHIDDVDILLKLSMKSDAIVIGPGLGMSEETQEAVVEYFSLIENKPLVVDADALKILSKHLELIREATAILTPHAGEFKILFGMEVPLNLKEKVSLVKKIASENKIVILLKGHEDIVSDGERVKVNYTGNPGMTVGGTGDVLSGIAATFLAWSNDAFHSASAAAFINGLAGDLAVKKLGYHITPLDVIDKIPSAMKKYSI